LSFVEEPVEAPVPVELFELTRLSTEPLVLPVVVLVPGVLFPVIEEPALEPPDVPAEVPDDAPPELPPHPPLPPACANANVEQRASADPSATVVSFMFVSLLGDRGNNGMIASFLSRAVGCSDLKLMRQAHHSNR